MPQTDGALVVACILMAAAGLTKMTAPGSALTAMNLLGLNAGRAMVRAIGSMELALAVATLAVGGWLPLAVGAAYCAFAVVVIALWRLGSEQSCGCFGLVSPAARPHHAAVDLLFAIACFASVRAPDLAEWLDAEPWADAGALGVTLVACALAATLVLGRRPGRTFPAPPKSTPLPAHPLEGVDLRGRYLRLPPTEADQWTLLAFLSTRCTTCRGLLRDLQRTRGRVGPARLVVVTEGPEVERPDRLEELAGAGIQIVMSSAAWDDYGIDMTPTFVLIDEASTIRAAELTGDSWRQLRSLVRQTVKATGRRGQVSSSPAVSPR